MRSFVKIKLSRFGEITLSFTDICKSCHGCEFNVVNMSLNAIREKKSRENFRIYRNQNTRRRLQHGSAYGSEDGLYSVTGDVISFIVSFRLNVF